MPYPGFNPPGTGGGITGPTIVGTWDTSVADFRTLLTTDDTALRVIERGSITIGTTPVTVVPGDLIVRTAGPTYSVDTQGRTNVFSSIEILGNGNTAEGADGNWRFSVDTEGQYVSDRYEAGTPVEKVADGDSVYSDRFLVNGIVGGLYFEEPDGQLRAITRHTPNGSLMSVGDEDLLSTIVSDQVPQMIVPSATQPTNPVMINSDKTATLATSTLTFNFTPTIGGRIDQVLLDSTGTTRARLFVRETGTDTPIYQTTSEQNFLNFNGGRPIAAGEQTITLIDIARIRPNIMYTVQIFTAEEVTYQGRMDGADFIPFGGFHLLAVDFRNIASEDWVLDQINSGAYDDPELTNLRINIPSRVDLNTDLNTNHVITYNAAHVDNISALTLQVTGGDDVSLVIPNADGQNIQQTIALTGVDTTTTGTLQFQIIGQDTRNPVQAITPSNTVTINIRDVAPQEFIYHGFSASDNDDTIDVSTLTSLEATAGSHTINFGPTASANQYLMVLAPSDHLLSGIFDALNVNQLASPSAWITTSNVRTIGGIAYTSYVLGPLNQGYTATLRLEVN